MNSDASADVAGTPVVSPLERLGRWDGTNFVNVEAGSVNSTNVHALCHGWCRGLAVQVDTASRFLHVWDQDATTEEGSRFDRWLAPLATAIVAADPDATVLAYSWADDAATSSAAMTALRSQRRTTVNGQRLAIGLTQALSVDEHRIHLIGYSHGAKVATISAALLEPPPVHLTILDSPENALPILGGALNDLSSYLRAIASGRGGTSTFVDNYVSHYGVRYGVQTGLGAVVDVVLDPDEHPIDAAPSDHAYSWAWYVKSAEDLDRGVGFAWSPLLGTATRPDATQLLQSELTGDGETTDCLSLEPAAFVATGGVAGRLRDRTRDVLDEPRTLSTSGTSSYSGVYWRRSGDLLAVSQLRWKSGPQDATVRIVGNGVERARVRRGWANGDEQRIRILLGTDRAGPIPFTVALESDEPAEVDVYRASAVVGINLPAGAEYRRWLRPFAFAAVVGAVGIAAVASRRLLRRSGE